VALCSRLGRRAINPVSMAAVDGEALLLRGEATVR